MGVSVGQAGSLYLDFVVAMFAVGPFHAYLVDEYKRKHVLLYSALIMLAAVLGYAFVDGYTKFLLLAAVQGACFGLATTAGITVAIDITTSARRSAGNMVYAWAARLGMLVGVVLGIGMYKMYGFRMVTYLSVAAGLASIFFASRVYVAFRAPIGVSLCNMDRFLLPRAWVPAINMLLIAFVPGALLPLMFVGDYWSLAALAVLVFITVPFMKVRDKYNQSYNGRRCSTYQYCSGGYVFYLPCHGMLLGRHQVDQLLNGGIEQFGCYHHSDAENDYHPLHAGNA